MSKNNDEKGTSPIEIEISGDQPVVIEKLFGPLIFASLRITADTKSNEWVIEREWIQKGEYIPWVRIPGQIKQEFTDNSFDEA